jgi:hypothetical protein
MIRYSLVQFWKMIPVSHAPDPVQTFREEDGFEMSRVPGDCMIRISYPSSKGGSIHEYPVSNMSDSKVIDTPQRAVEQAKPAESTRPFMRAAEILTAPAEKAKKR